jgi:dipeptidyl aminopeptidase/acylaminoacyl peptidase
VTKKLLKTAGIACWAGIFFIPAVSFSFPVRAAAPPAQEDKRVEQSIGDWLVLGPVTPAFPAFHEDKKRGFGAEDLLKFEEFDLGELRPAAGKTVRWPDGNAAEWREAAAAGGLVELAPVQGRAGLAYLAASIETSRWIRVKLTFTTGQMIQISLDGRTVATKSRAEADGRLAVDLRLETGTHLLLVKTVYDPETRSPWKIGAALEMPERFASPAMSVSTRPADRLSLGHLLDGPKASGVSVSPEGTCVALTMTRTLPPTDESESWLELYQIENGRTGLASKLVRTFRGGAPITSVAWAPRGKRFSYATQDKNGGTIWIVDQAAGTTTPLLRNVKNLGFHAWAPDGLSIVFTVTEEGEEDSVLAKRFQTLEDRQPGWRNRSYLHRVSIPDGVRQRLTAGELATALGAFSPDGKKILFFRNIVDYSERPYSKTELYTLDLATLEADLVWKGKWLTSAQWSPNGKRLLILGGPSAFGEAGVNVPKGFVPNEYDIQAYLYDLETKAAAPITREFGPSITRAFWPDSGETILLLATDAAFARVYEYNPAKKTFARVEAGVEVVEQIDVAAKAPVAALIGSGATVPPRTILLDLQRKEVRPLREAGRDDYGDVVFGKVETWTFKNRKGVDIDGYVFYPPDFDPLKKYPLIVNYYGGTTPITRDFGGRYPKALYAAHGYLVYVLEPSGAIGYGQEFSALHVNDWGAIVAEEIIDGVRKFLAAHPFADPRRVGAIGASFGGFMTMLLTTRTNIFTAAVSHAGISSISGYWGEGYWGYSYSSVATADSFPWNRKDIYVTQSPLFNADKITTPLLLLHGSVDTNVPPGESTQLFTALKLLGREVEYVQFLEQNHHVLTYNKRILWTKTILAWFDRWLKGQPEWWLDLYPAR